MSRRWGIALLAVAVAAVAMPIAGAQGDAGDIDACDWSMYGNGPGRTFAVDSECETAISPLTAPTLRPRWVYPTHSSVTATPTVVDDWLYVGDWSGTFYRFAAEQPDAVAVPDWTFTIDDPNGTSFGRIVSTAAVADVDGTRVVLFGGGATLYVLDAETGAELTRACLDPRPDPSVRCLGTGPGSQIEIESSPVVLPGEAGAQVLVGTDVHNDANLGHTGVHSLRLEHSVDGWSFPVEWSFDPESGYATTGPDAVTDHSHAVDGLAPDAKGLGCGGVWGSPTVDTAAEMVYFGTSSCSRDGVDTGESVYAIGLDDGMLAWEHHPFDGADRFDDDFGSTANLLPGGLVGIGRKDGQYYVFDRDKTPDEDGQLAPDRVVAAGQPGRINTDFSIGGIIGSPSVGEVNGAPAVFATTAISSPFAGKVAEDGPFPDPAVLADPGRMFSIHAFSPETGEILWRSPLTRQSYAATSYANGVVFVPSTVGFSVTAYHADTGAPLWTGLLNGAPSAGVAVTDDAIFVGTGTSLTDAGFKLTEGETVVDQVLVTVFDETLSGVWAFAPDPGASLLAPLEGLLSGLLAPVGALLAAVLAPLGL